MAKKLDVITKISSVFNEKRFCWVFLPFAVLQENDLSLLWVISWAGSLGWFLLLFGHRKLRLRFIMRWLFEERVLIGNPCGDASSLVKKHHQMKGLLRSSGEGVWECLEWSATAKRATLFLSLLWDFFFWISLSPLEAWEKNTHFSFSCLKWSTSFSSRQWGKEF